MNETKQEKKVRKKAYRKARRKATRPWKGLTFFRRDHFHCTDSDISIFVDV